MKLIKSDYSLLIFPIISLFGGLWQGQFTDDGYHWGFMLSNALDLIDGKIPYKEIFLEYGILSPIIHAITLKLFNNNILSLIGITCVFYSLSIFFIGKIIKEFTINKNYAFIATLILFLIYPWPVTPWPNFISFFFTTLFAFFYLSEKKTYNVLAGLALALAYLSFTTVYNFIVILFILIISIFIFLNFKYLKKSFIQKNIYFISSFIFLISIFIFYLMANKLFMIWINYQQVPFIMKDIVDISIQNKIINYIYFLFIYSINNFIYEPQLFFFLIVFISNIIVILNISKNFYKFKKFTKKELNLFVINILIFSLNIYAQLSDIDKFATSLSLGIISLIFLIDSIKDFDKKIIINFVILFISSYSFIFAFGLENANHGASRNAYYKDLKNIKEKIKNTEILYFTKQKWSKNTWYHLNLFVDTQKRIKKKCNIEYAANLTSNTYYYVLFEYKKIQVIPFFYKDLGSTFISFFDKDLINKLQKLIYDNNIIITTSENNDKLLNFDNYADPKRIDLNFYNKKLNKFLYIYYPKKCEITPY